MLVPDFTPYSVPHPASVYDRMMMSMVEQGRNYRGYLSQPRPVLSPPVMTRSPPRLLFSPPDLFRDESILDRPDFHSSHPMKLHIPAVSTPQIHKSDMVVSPISSEEGSGLSPSSEVSQFVLSSEDYEKESVDSKDVDEDGERKAFKCPQCMYFTDRKNNLKRHIVTMHQECSRSLECCGVSFHSKAALRDHVGLFHRGGYRCQICSRNFCRKALLRRHLTVHSGRKDFSCNLCGYATSHKSNLERHQKVHLRRPVCPATRDHSEILPVVSSVETTSNTRYYPKFGCHKEKTLNRFVLLPNRLKYTHDIDRVCTNKELPSVPRLYSHDEENNDEDEVSMSFDSTVRYNGTVVGETPDSFFHRPFEIVKSENIKKEVSMISKTPKRRLKSTKPYLLSSKRRIFVMPYKCSDCGEMFSKQAEFHGHNCRTLGQSNDASLSVITAVRKGKIKLLSQLKSSFKDQTGNAKSASDNDVDKIVIQIPDD